MCSSSEVTGSRATHPPCASVEGPRACPAAGPLAYIRHLSRFLLGQLSSLLHLLHDRLILALALFCVLSPLSYMSITVASIDKEKGLSLSRLARAALPRLLLGAEYPPYWADVLVPGMRVISNQRSTVPIRPADHSCYLHLPGLELHPWIFSEVAGRALQVLARCASAGSPGPVRSRCAWYSNRCAHSCSRARMKKPVCTGVLLPLKSRRR